MTWKFYVPRRLIELMDPHITREMLKVLKDDNNFMLEITEDNEYAKKIIPLLEDEDSKIDINEAILHRRQKKSYKTKPKILSYVLTIESSLENYTDRIIYQVRDYSDRLHAFMAAKKVMDMHEKEGLTCTLKTIVEDNG